MKFEARIKELVEDLPDLADLVEPLLISGGRFASRSASSSSLADRATLFARANMVVTNSLFVCALSFSGAIFLVLELDDPFRGLMGISSSILRSALLPLNP